jgi:hypothetical protein
LPLLATANLAAQATSPKVPEKPKNPSCHGKRRKAKKNLLSAIRDRPLLSSDEAINIAVYKAANRGVVNIAPVASAEDYILNHTAEGCGSGVIISRDGSILPIIMWLKTQNTCV